MVHKEATPVNPGSKHYNMAGVTWQTEDLLKVSRSTYKKKSQNFLQSSTLLDMALESHEVKMSSTKTAEHWDITVEAPDGVFRSIIL